MSISVDPHQTAKLGWKRGETYFDTYAPSLPKAVRESLLLRAEHDIFTNDLE